MCKFALQKYTFAEGLVKHICKLILQVLSVSVGEVLRLAREAKGLSKQALADACGEPYSQIHRVENGDTKSPGVDLVGKMCEVLHLPPSELFFRAGLTRRMVSEVNVAGIQALLAEAQRQVAMAQAELEDSFRPPGFQDSEEGRTKVVQLSAMLSKKERAHADGSVRTHQPAAREIKRKPKKDDSGT